MTCQYVGVSVMSKHCQH